MILAEASCRAEGIEDGAFCFTGATARFLVFSCCSNCLKVVGSIAVFTFHAVGGSFALPYPGWGVLDVAMLATIITWIGFFSSCLSCLAQ